VPLTLALKSAYIGEWIFSVCEVQEVCSGRCLMVRDFGQSAIHVIGLCLCDVTAKRWYLQCCILHERSLDGNPLLRKASRNYGEVIRRRLSLNFLFGKIGIKSGHLYEHRLRK